MRVSGHIEKQTKVNKYLAHVWMKQHNIHFVIRIFKNLIISFEKSQNRHTPYVFIWFLTLPTHFCLIGIGVLFV